MANVFTEEKKRIKSAIITHCRELGMKCDEKGYLSTPEENLLEPFSLWNGIKARFLQGQGSELRAHGNNQPKFHAVHSSAALCVNSFFQYMKNENNTPFLGYKDFTRVVFEEKLPTGISSPNVDFYLENEDVIIGIESKYIEVLSPKKPNTNLDKYIRRVEQLSAVPNGFIDQVVEYYLNKKEKYFLDVAQLIKHSLGLFSKGRLHENKTIILVYLYWQPENWEDFSVYTEHKKEIEEFAQRVSNFIKFTPLTYPEYWNMVGKDTELADYVEQLRKRYSLYIRSLTL